MATDSLLLVAGAGSKAETVAEEIAEAGASVVLHRPVLAVGKVVTLSAE